MTKTTIDATASYSGVVIDVLTVEVLVDARLDALTTVYTGIKMVTLSAIDVDMLANVLAAVVTAWKYIVSTSLADFC